MTMRCEICDRELKLVDVKEYDYTARTGLDPKYHRITLVGITGYECACGVSPVIPNMDGLHFTIGLMIIQEEAPIEGSAIRFMRKTLGMTQKEFAAEIEIHEQTMSKWERNEAIPERCVRVYAATVFLSHLFKREEIINSMSMEVVSETMDLLVSRNTPKTVAKAQIAVDLGAAPPAWMIAKLERVELGTGSGRNCN